MYQPLNWQLVGILDKTNLHIYIYIYMYQPLNWQLVGILDKTNLHIYIYIYVSTFKLTVGRYLG